MIAPIIINEDYDRWNSTWGAPYGYDQSSSLLKSSIAKLIKLPFIPNFLPKTVIGLRTLGPFSLQPNNSTRRFEYPWVYRNGKFDQNKIVLDIGGGFGGLQFAVSKTGAKVINIDPGDKLHSWEYTQKKFDLLNRAFGTNVSLVQKTIDNAHIPDSSIDVVYCVSVIEHLDNYQRIQLLQNVNRVLKDNGIFVVTVDLFLDLEPFTKKKSNRWGENVKISQIVKESGMKLYFGNKNELYGYKEFNAITIQTNLGRYLIGSGYPALAQLFILKKN